MKVSALALALLAPLASFADPSGIRTDRPNPADLPLPAPDESFHFIVFGDRTGGPPEGIEVLKRAVADANLLGPDLVMTVGDLVQGYNAAGQWQVQMEEYRETMGALRVPWFPVAGNHDIYWRGDGRTPHEHEQAYEKHFGPLWYWFEHKRSGFLVLFTDEGDPARPDKPRNFGDPAQHSFSDRQLAWLEKSLEEMKDLRQIFVFMHHPRWAKDIYPGSNWDRVHERLVANGNVKACFAGHIHRLRYEESKDGIQYFTLAATGGHIAGDHPDLGFLHHFNLVSVRADGIHVAALPVGGVIDPKTHTPERIRDVNLARAMAPRPVAPFALDSEGRGSGPYELKLSNPSSRPLDVTLSVTRADGWTIHPKRRRTLVQPGGELTLAFSVTRDGSGYGGDFAAPVFSLASDYLEEETRSALPGRRFPLQIALGLLEDEVFRPADVPMALHVTDRSSGVKVESADYDLPDGPFTLECRVKPDQLHDTAGIVAKTEGSEFGFHANGDRVTFLVHLGDRYASVQSGPVLKSGSWTHLAGVFDGAALTLYADGEPAGSTPASGLRTRNDLPLYIGADPDRDGRPSRAFTGWIDEVRLSKGAVYRDAFTPAERLERAEDTVLLFHGDRLVGGQWPDRSASRAHGLPVGKAALKPVKP